MEEKQLFVYETRIETAKERLKEVTSPADYTGVCKFADSGNATNGKNISNNRKYKRLLVLKKLAETTGKPLEKLKEKDLKKYMDKITNAHSKESDAALIKSFYRWLDEKKYFDLLKCKALKVTNPYSELGNTIDAKDLLTEKECLDLVNAAQYVRDKALISLLILGGFRIGEVSAIRRKDLTFCDDKAIIVSVKGKTGLRNVKIYGSLTKHIVNWYDQMTNTKPDAYVFTTLDGHRRCSYAVMNKFLMRAKERAGIIKPLTFHKIRHRHATWSLVNMKKALAYKRLGWTPNSNMENVYSHVQDSEADEDYLQALGIKKNTKQPEFIEKECLSCGKKYSSDKEICVDCQLPLGELRISAEDAVLFKEMVTWFLKEKKK